MTRKTRYALILSALIVVGFFSGYFLRYLIEEKSNKIIKIARYESGYSYINPLLECSFNEIDVEKMRNLEKKIKNLVNKNIKENKINNASIYFHDLKNGGWFNINGLEKFAPASLLKVPVVIAVLRYAENNPDVLKKEILITEEHVLDVIPSIPPQREVVVDKTYTVDELIHYSLYYSDNTAINVLLQFIPVEYFNKVFADMGIKLDQNEEIEDFMSIIDYASFFEILYNSSYLNRTMSEKVLEMLTQTTFHSGIVAGVPIKVTVAHKFGERTGNTSKQIHDCGIVYKKNNPYLLCVMTKTNLTRGNDLEEMIEVIKDISSLVYKSF